MKKILGQILFVLALAQALAITALAAPPTATSFSIAVPVSAQSLIQLQGADVDGTPLTFATTSSPTHGALSNLNTATGVVIYTPVTGYIGADSFKYTVTSGGETSAEATVTITVTSGKTRIVDVLLNPDGSPRSGKVSFFLTLLSTSPSGIIPPKASASAVLNGAGQFDISVFPSRAVSPVQYYQVWFDDSKGGSQFLGVYDIPASTTAISLVGHQITNTNLGAQYVFISRAEAQALTAAVAAAQAAQLYPTLVGGKHIVWNGTTFANSLISESGSTVTVAGNTTFTGEVTAAGVNGIRATDVPNHDAGKLTSGTVNDARLPATLTGKTLVNPTITGNPSFGTIGGLNVNSLSATGTVTASAFVGNGALLTGVLPVGGVGGNSSTGSLTLLSNSGNGNPSAVVDIANYSTTLARFNADKSVTLFGGALSMPSTAVGKPAANLYYSAIPNGVLGTYNPTLTLSYNQQPNGALVQAGEPGLMYSIEADYHLGSNHYMEAYLQYKPASGSGGLRPFFFQIDRATNEVISAQITGPLGIMGGDGIKNAAQFMPGNAYISPQPDDDTRLWIQAGPGKNSLLYLGRDNVPEFGYLTTTADGFLLSKPLRTEKAAFGTNDLSNTRALTLQEPGGELLSLNDSTGVTKWHFNLNGNDLQFVETGVDLRLALKAGIGINVTGVIQVGGTQVVGPRCTAVADATGSGDAHTQLNLLLACLRSHGLLAP